MENIERIIVRAKQLADRVESAIEHQNNLIQGSFNVTGAGFTKTIEELENKVRNSTEKLESVQKKVAEAKLKVAELTEEFESISAENSSLAKSENSLLSQAKLLRTEQYEIAQELEKKVKTYKELTGVRFNFEGSEDVLDGYIAISENAPSDCSFVPFKLDKNNFSCSQQLWKKINETCMDTIEYN